jgi:hypothetical protein
MHARYLEDFAVGQTFGSDTLRVSALDPRSRHSNLMFAALTTFCHFAMSRLR